MVKGCGTCHSHASESRRSSSPGSDRRWSGITLTKRRCCGACNHMHPGCNQKGEEGGREGREERREG